MFVWLLSLLPLGGGNWSLHMPPVMAREGNLIIPIYASAGGE